MENVLFRRGRLSFFSFFYSLPKVPSISGGRFFFSHYRSFSYISCNWSGFEDWRTTIGSERLHQVNLDRRKSRRTITLLNLYIGRKEKQLASNAKINVKDASLILYDLPNFSSSVHAYKISLKFILVSVYITSPPPRLTDMGRTPFRDTDKSSPVSPLSSKTSSPPVSPTGRGDAKSVSPTFRRKRVKLKPKTITWTKTRTLLATATITAKPRPITRLFVVNRLF